MKTIFTILAMIISVAGFSQKTIALSPKISIQLPKNAIAFDDKEYKESMKFFGSGEAFIMLTKDIYKVDDIIIRIVVVRGECPADFIKKGKESDYYNYRSNAGYLSAISSSNGNEQLITTYNLTAIGNYKSSIYNIATKKCVKVEIEYPIKDGNKKKAGDILNEMSKSIVFK